MIRVLLVILAVLIAVLAFVLDRPLLYAAAGVSLGTALVLIGRRLWRSNAGRPSRSASGSGPRSESLEDLGIMEVRPQSKQDGDGQDGPAQQTASQERPGQDETGTSARPVDTASDDATEPPVDPARSASRSHPADPTSDASPEANRESASGASPETRADDESQNGDASDRDWTGDHPAVSPRPDEAAQRGEDRDDETTAVDDGDSAPASARDGTSNTDGAPAANEDAAEPAATEPAGADADLASAEDAATEEPATADEEADPRRNGVTTTAVADEPVLAPFVESMRAALGAHTVCFLVQEDVVLDYEIRAIASAESDVRRSGTFSTQEPLLTASMTQQSVTIRPLDGEGAVDEFLGYYQTGAPIDHVALAPIQRPNDPATYFLLADATSDTDLGTTRARRLLERFAETLGLVLEGDESVGVSSTSFADGLTGDGGTPTTTASEAAAAERAHAEAEETTASQSSPRPRSEIIDEEMEAADEENEPLALVLVHLNEAEALAQEGEEAVAAAEKKLRTRLEDAAPGSRVARFGELTYGIFFRGPVDSVEPWAVELKRELGEETGLLDGGVSIGVAMRGARHDGDPESLRADATEALREAYQSGTATIIE